MLSLNLANNLDVLKEHFKYFLLVVKNQPPKIKISSQKYEFGCEEILK